MKDFYAAVREDICLLMREAGFRAEARDIYCAAPAAEAETALPGRLRIPAEQMCAELRRRPRPWISGIWTREERICFSLSNQFYREQISYILEQQPDLPPLEDGSSPVSYAYMRLRMMARGQGQVLDAVSKQLLWAGMGLAEQNSTGRRFEHSLLRVYAAMQELSGGPPRQRSAYLALRGCAAGCAARLLYMCAISTKE